ncbi:MAG: xylose isomerase [SAR86 cluster bacterium]|uniref:Xylose isomerase n=1 Tax=SAR86 cluster bacterium TaxID=2030880 RepID=A0A2A5B0E1_9GAMM|nr:MAG: xylose isomerase [SAR86 cluster bacterium]
MQNRIYSRRSFLKSAAILGVAAMSPMGIAVAQSRKVERPGLQLYTLRDDMSQDFEGTLAHVAELGYKEMEFAGYFGRSPAQVRRILDSNGMTSPASHIQLQAIRTNLEKEIEAAVAIGQKYIVVPIVPGDERSISHFQQHADTLNKAGEACKAAGIKMAYHNHNFEFVLTDGRIPYDILLEETDPDLVTMELDLFWIRNAGVDPVPYFENHPGRFSMLHVKDMDEHGRMVDVGRGAINFAELFSYSDIAGVQHYFVEHDRPGNGLASVAVSLYTLRNLRF